MSANFAWNHATKISEDDPTAEGAMYTPLFFGSDKTTVSVATGNVEYHPGYLSIGNIHNRMRRAHRNGVVPLVFLAIPKSERKHDKDSEFRKFKRQLYHASLAAVLSILKPGMTTPVVRRCPDGHFRKAIYDLGPVIADYPEQVMLAGIV
ncbi:C2H2-type domain-containing protein [Mycena sanguinolenta]|uniref:C2H2-type domain-containing protein n=1 Tax=Mycena sanguinolenta TaxID=230812 RepID=A0A8H6Z7N6_9AGAR|nr:C2H2-type domain-containing protein [Mycena sanguinolenta]